MDGADPAAEHTSIALSLRGVTRRIDAATRIQREGDRILVTGRAAIDQTAFGIVPFAILGGAIAVRDRIDLRFRVVAVPLRPTPGARHAARATD